MKIQHRNPYTAYDASFAAKVDAWQLLDVGFLDAFGREGLDALNERERGFSAEKRKIVSLTFENRFAQLGGLAAVMRFLPTFLKKYGEDVILMTPHYVNIPKVREAVAGGALELIIDSETIHVSPEAACPHEVTYCCYRNDDMPVSAYFIGIDGRFTADQNPYSYADGADLLEDALAFCAVVPHVLARLGFTRDILFHAHDWETAPIAITSKRAVLDGVLENARTVLTLHNSFDSGVSVDKKEQYFFAGADRERPGGGGIRGDTVLQCAIPLLNGPLTTVSAPFADELRTDPLQRSVFTNHLQDMFTANPPVGIENGMFGRPYLRYTYTALSRARQGDFTALLKQKTRFREKMLEIVKAMDRPEVVGKLDLWSDGSGDASKTIDCDRPIFFMSGRLDLMQKGFDVIFQAIKKLPPGKIGLIFCPSSAEGAKHAEELAFFRGIASERPGDIVIWPFRIASEDYASVVLGSSFLLMPSFYEPFGAATEGFMHGTPVIARATGGLLVQVRAEPADGSTGFLYHESASGDDIDCGEWKRILDAPVGERMDVPLYRSMVDEACIAMENAADVFANCEEYGQMMLNGMESLRDFTWDVAIGKYRRIYDVASHRGFVDS
ncbi:MAG: glycogen/starch synthase [Chitinispirillales bacterium]|jgi:glycogen synthase|nr:glycogen/starch synthase [Chitinispirillales bacterium]